MKIKGIILFVICVMLHIAATAQDRSVDIRRLLFEANTLQNGGKMAEAAEKLKSIIEIDATYKVAYLRLATLYNTSDEKVKNLSEAQKNYEKYLSLETDIAKKDSLKKVLDDVKKRIDDIDSDELTAALEENFVLSNTQEQQDTVNHHSIHLDMNADIIDDIVTDNSGEESELSEIDQIVAFMLAPDEKENAPNAYSIQEIGEDEDYLFPEINNVSSVEDLTSGNNSSEGQDIDDIMKLFNKTTNAQDDDISNPVLPAKIQDDDENYLIDSKKPLITFVQPYNLTELDFNTLTADASVSTNYISALFSHISGVDLLKIRLSDTGQPTLDSNCGIVRAYSQIMGLNSKSQELKHGITLFDKNANNYHLRLEYEMPDSMTKGIELLHIVDLMIGDYLRAKKVTYFSQNYNELLKMKETDTLNLAKVTVVYDFTLKPKRGLLVGEAIINVVKHFDQDYAVASYTGQQVFLPVDESYSSSEIDNVDLIQESDPERFLDKLEADYRRYNEWHQKLTETDYDETELYGRLGAIVRSGQPEAIYEMYIGNMAKLWYIKSRRGESQDIKKRMIKIGNILKNSI